MEKIELIIFDMDGLMFDTEKISFRVWKEVLEKYGYDFDFSIFSKMIGSNLLRIKDICLKEYGEDFPFDLVKEERYVLTNSIIEKEGIPIKKGLRELLDFLDPLNIKKAVATSSGRDRASIFFNKTDLTKYFDYILCGNEVKKSKPDPEIFLTVAKKLNCDVKNTIVLEDSEVGIIAAYKGGMIPFLVPDMKQPSQEILDICFQSFTSLLDVKQYLEKVLKEK